MNLMSYYLQKFEAYDSKGAVVAGDKNKEVMIVNFFSSILWIFLDIQALLSANEKNALNH